ncbi:hypothetical protein [Lysinibacillus sphaericus]|uniref:hypothetical protein n=1 Tax=Lysinibacillus sphaericus TaxID=1421 RepID=UPI001A9FDC17|nr:hypothetical protein [Lysinibacillus sphaericus]QTB28452.1 hypothetical protein J2D51_07475 [Lysinibacillus sphaericus]
MYVEYQINLDYADGKISESKSYRFENAEVRNMVFNQIVSDFSNDKVDMNHLRQFSGITIDSYDYYEPNINTIAPFVPHASFKMDILDEILNLLEQKSKNSSIRIK